MPKSYCAEAFRRAHRPWLPCRDPAGWQLPVAAGFLCFCAARPVIALTFLMAT